MKLFQMTALKKVLENARAGKLNCKFIKKENGSINESTCTLKLNELKDSYEVTIKTKENEEYIISLKI